MLAFGFVWFLLLPTKDTQRSSKLTQILLLSQSLNNKKKGYDQCTYLGGSLAHWPLNPGKLQQQGME